MLSLRLSMDTQVEVSTLAWEVRSDMCPRSVSPLVHMNFRTVVDETVDCRRISGSNADLRSDISREFHFDLLRFIAFNSIQCDGSFERACHSILSRHRSVYCS